ncbi:MAG TPA: ubiquitin-like domain-containing protein [Jatrophihabitantaceae bacterium]|nr:ubiquitin-like domain-containing protein [Jatrophihabitantaceae bacterium]
MTDRKATAGLTAKEFVLLLRSVKYGLYAAVLAGVIGGTVAWHRVDKTVDLRVDGQATHVHTTAARVGDVLAGAGYRVGAHDIVAPSLDAAVHDGSSIVLERGRLLHLDVNGVHRDIWTTAPTVAQALTDLGYSTADFTTVSRSQRLPLGATDLSLRTPRFVTVVHDGITVQVTTTDGTVAQLLADLNIAVNSSDTVSVPVGSTLAAGQRIVVGRVAHTTITASKVLPFATKKTVESSISSGQTKVVTPGKDGLAQVTYAVVTVDGKVVGKTPIKTVVVRAPTPQVLGVGSANTPTASPAAISVTPGSAQAIARDLAAQRGWGDSEFSCLVTLWDHESGWRVNAANPSGAYGIPQALPGSKMASAGPDWQTNATTQITWGLDYIQSRYSTPCSAWSSWQANGGWY